MSTTPEMRWYGVQKARDLYRRQTGRRLLREEIARLCSATVGQVQHWLVKPGRPSHRPMPEAAYELLMLRLAEQGIDTSKTEGEKKS